jgi:hypothetical protein
MAGGSVARMSNSDMRDRGPGYGFRSSGLPPWVAQTFCLRRITNRIGIFRCAITHHSSALAGCPGTTTDERASAHRRRWRRHSPGLVPTRRVKVLVKWLCSEKPQSSAISASGRADHSSRSWARSRRRCTSQRCGVRPMVFLKVQPNRQTSFDRPG